MPLDNSGYGSPDYQAMLILPSRVGEHLGHQCVKGIWISAAQELFCNKLHISAAQLYVTTADEVKTGHLIGHKGKICVFGSSVDPFEGEKADDYHSPIEAEWIYTPSDVYLEFPETTERLLDEKYDFDAVVIANSNILCLCKVDLEKSRSSKSITLHRPTGIYPLFETSIIILR